MSESTAAQRYRQEAERITVFAEKLSSAELKARFMTVVGHYTWLAEFYEKHIVPWDYMSPGSTSV